MTFAGNAGRAALAIGCALSIVSPLPALAQPKPKVDAEKAEAAPIKSAADALMDQDRYAEAVALYQRAYELTRDPALLYNQGRAFEALGDYPTALEKLEIFDREAPAATRAKVPGLRELIADLRGRIATLVVRTNAPNAKLLVRQKDEGLIGGEKQLATRAGTVAVVVEAEGYESFRREFTLSAGSTVVVDARLVSKNREALLVVRTKPSAAVFLDGKPLGPAPLQAHIAAGSHAMLVRLDGYEEQKIPLTLASGDRRELDLALHAKPGITSRWWFWTGLGLAALGGVATGIALSTEKPHSSGSFSPGAVAGP